MTCKECVEDIKKRLLDIDCLIKADIQLNAPQATLIMHCRVTISMLQAAIGSKYTITERTLS